MDSLKPATKRVPRDRLGGSWTEESVEKLIELHKAGALSFSGIAKALGNGISKNACIGKARRLGLDPRSRENCSFYDPEHERKRHRANQCRYIERLKAKGVKYWKKKSPTDASPLRRSRASGSRKYAVPSAASPTPSLNIPLIETNSRQCKHIAGDDGLCCAHPTFGNSSWCDFHWHLVSRA